MGLLEGTAGKVRSALQEITTRSRYDGRAIQLLEPFTHGRYVDPAWSTALDVFLLKGGREEFVNAAAALLPPKKRAILLINLVTDLGERTFHPRSVSSDGDIIGEIWSKSTDKQKLRSAIRSMKISGRKRRRIMEAFTTR